MTLQNRHYMPSNLYYWIIFFSAVIINALGGFITSALSAPILLDTIGSIYATCIIGPVGGCGAGILSAILQHPGNIRMWSYTICIIPIVLSSRFIYQKTHFQDSLPICCAGLLNATYATVCAVPINLFLFDGHMNNIWGNALFEKLLLSGNSKLFSNLLGQLLIELPDKMLTIFLVYKLLQFTDFILNHITKDGGVQ